MNAAEIQRSNAVGRALATLYAYELYASQQRNVVLTAQESPEDLLHAHQALDSARTDAIVELLEHRPAPRREVEITVADILIVAGLACLLSFIVWIVVPLLGGVT